MTSGISKTSLAKTLCAIVAASVPTIPCLAAPPDTSSTETAAAIVSGLKRDTPARTPYTEVRFSGLFDRPLILHGELEYRGPGELGKRVDAPYHEQTTVADGEASVKRGDHPARKFSLGQAPELEGFLRGFAALLGGDAATLAKDFKLTSSGTPTTRWQLVLKPRDDRLARRIKSIDVSGLANEPSCFITHEGDGDTSVLLVGKLAAVELPTRPSQPQVDGVCRGIDVN